MKHLFCVLICAFALHPICSSASASHDYYVSPAGNDSNNGSLAHPWKTIAHAVVTTGPGDTVNLRAGSYTEKIEMRGDAANQFGRAMGGSSSGWWTLQSYPGEISTLDGGFYAAYSVQYSRFQNLNFVNGGKIYVGTVDWSTPAGVRSHDIEILNNTFSGAQVRYGFIEVMFDNSRVEGNRITISDGGTTTDHGIYLHNGRGNVLRGNIVDGASGYGIHVYDERKRNSDPQTAITNVIVEGNVLTGSRLRAGLIISQGGDTVVDGVIVRNNVISGNKKCGIDLTSYGSLRMKKITVHDNKLSNNGNCGIIGGAAIDGSEITDNNIEP